MSLTSDEALRLQGYLRKKFGNDNITLRAREKAVDSAEILINGEFIGTIYKDTEDGETSYDFNMAILDVDIAS